MTSVQANVQLNNAIPTLTTFAAPVISVPTNTETAITMDDLLAQGNEADSDGSVFGFVVQSGSINIGTSLESAQPFSENNYMIDATHHAYWASDATTGEQNVFTVKAVDENGGLSATAINVPINVYGDAPLVMPTTGLMTWVSAKDVDGNGVADSTVNGTTISSLVDKSGNSNDFSVIYPYSAPTFYSSTSMLMFNDNSVSMGVSGRVTTAMESTFNWKATAADAAEIFLVGYMPSTLPSDGVTTIDTNRAYMVGFSGNVKGIAGNDDDSGYYYYAGGSSPNRSGQSGYQDEALIWNVKISGASTTVWRSDDGLVARTTSDVIDDAVNAGVTLGIDGIHRDSNGAKGFVGELLIYDQELSSADRISVKQYLADEWSITAVDPILIDLDSDGIEMVQSTVFNQFAMTPDGTATPTNWLSSDDGLLALDINGNGKIDNITELFSEYFAEGINTGLGALSTLDENSDGIIDQNDSQFSNLQVWQDLNQDGISTADELKSLAEHGIESFDLNVTKTNESLLESTLLSNGSVGMSDGTTKSFSEVAFAVENKVVDSILVAESIDLSAIVAAGANNIEQINMQGSGSDTLSINIQDVLDITDSNNILFIDGDTGDQVIIENGWQRQVSNSESVSGYQQFSMEGVEATLYIDEDVSKLVMNS
jgi:hypothetical protein